MTRHLPALFIGSSSESLEVARAVRSQLDESAEVTIWNEGPFRLSEAYLASLVKAARDADFAVLVLGDDDWVESRDGRLMAPRDNVVFECGLFMGSLGPSRTFLVHDLDAKVKVPSDLSGVTLATFHGDRKDGNLVAAVGPASDRIRAAIRRLGRRPGMRATEVDVGDSRLLVTPGSGDWLHAIQLRELDDGYSFRLRGTPIKVVHGRIQEVENDDETAFVLPANEFFDDDCVNDSKSALGAFVQRHFTGKVLAFQQLVAQSLVNWPTTLVEKRPNTPAASYGMGTCLPLDAPLGCDLRLLLVAVTTDRHPHGLRSDMRCLVEGVRNCLCEAHQRRIKKLVLPLMGAGHGGLHAEFSLATMLLALADAIRLAGHGLASVTIVVYRDPKTKRTAIEPDAIRDIVASTARWLA